MFIKVAIMYLGIYIFHIYVIDSKSSLEVRRTHVISYIRLYSIDLKVNSKISDI